jgi:hypothetical protein
MTSQYPRVQQNPPTQPGARPDEQPAPQRRVPLRFEQAPGEADPRGIDSGWTGGQHVEGFQERQVEEIEGTPPARPNEDDNQPPHRGSRENDGAELKTTGAKGGLEDMALSAPSEDSHEVNEMAREARKED